MDGALGNWKRMLDGKNYPVVGRLQYPEPGTTEAEEQARVERVIKLPLCQDALKNRPGMTESLTKAMSAMVKDGKLDINKMAKGGGAVAGAGAAAGAGAGKAQDPKARDAIKEQIQRGHADAQKKKEQAPPGHGHGHAEAPPNGARAANPHAPNNPHAGGPPANNIPSHHHSAQKPLGHGGAAERDQLKQGKVMGHAEAGDAAEAVGGVPPHGGRVGA